MDVRGYIHQNKTSDVRNLGSLDISRLKERVLGISDEDWSRYDATKPNTFEAFGTTRHLVLRFVHKLSNPIDSYALAEWDAWKGDVVPLLMQTAGFYGYEQVGFPRVMLANVPPGGAIKPHRDGGKYPSFCHKVHVPLSTNPEVGMYIEPDWYHLPEGNACEVNNNKLHTVQNKGKENRIHLVFELFKAPLRLEEHQVWWETEPPAKVTS